MCNACGNVCCGSDRFNACGCDGCDCEDCWSDDDGPECDHDDYEADILTGIAACTRCGERWMQTREQIEAERRAQMAWDRQCEEWDKEGWPPVPNMAQTGDEIPF